jgi:hypothetical protein
MRFELSAVNSLATPAFTEGYKSVRFSIKS